MRGQEGPRDMKITVVGLGYVGTVAAAGLAFSGHDVIALDIGKDRVNSLRAGIVPFYEPGLQERLRLALSIGSLRFCHLDEVDEELGEAVLISTGTPPTHGGAADLQQVRKAVNWVKDRASNDLVVVMKSTVPPGTGHKILQQQLTGTGIRYASNPEFLREGEAVADWDHPDRIVIGTTPGDCQSTRVVKEMHAGSDAPCMVTDITSAEMIKYASNAFLATRISFINEMASLCDNVGASIDEVSQGLAMDSRTGSRIHAGVGYGGSCFPKDVRALDHLALTTGASVEMLRAVVNTNNRQRLLPLHALRHRFGHILQGMRVGVLGLSFKPGTDDIREAPSLDLIRALVDEGARVQAYDPQAAETAQPFLPAEVGLLNSVAEAADRAQALILVTEWKDIVDSDWQVVARCMLPPRFVFDGRNALNPLDMDRLGFEYVGVGRSVCPRSGSELAAGAYSSDESNLRAS